MVIHSSEDWWSWGDCKSFLPPVTYQENCKGLPGVDLHPSVMTKAAESCTGQFLHQEKENPWRYSLERHLLKVILEEFNSGRSWCHVHGTTVQTQIHTQIMP